MPDETTLSIARRSHALATGQIPDEVVELTRLRIVDTLGCAIGAYDSPPAAVVHRLAVAEGAPSRRVAHILGWGTPASIELAGFANAAMARYLDYNDTFTSESPGHPSDMIGGLLALAEAEGLGGMRLIKAVVCAYEAYGVIAKELSVRERGWDQGVMINIGAAAGAAALLGLDERSTAQGVSLAVTAGVPTRASRAGTLSMWKGCATASATRLGVFSAMLAGEGMTGPDRAIEGKHGLWEQVTGRFGVRPFGPPEPWVMAASAIKLIPAEYNAHVAVELMTELREQVRTDQIASVHVSTYWNAFDEIGNDPQKWNPTTRETADHSLPYLLAVALFDGNISAGSFDDTHLGDPRLREFMQRITVAEDPALSAAWPGAVPARLEVTLVDGERIVRAADHPRGHPKRPAMAEDVDWKFLSLAKEPLGVDRAQEALVLLGRLEDLDDVGALVAAFAVPVGANR